MTREEAFAAGSKTYDPDSPCYIGHICRRVTKSNRCCECVRLSALNGAVRIKANQRKYYESNKQKVIQRAKEYGDAFPEKSRSAKIKWREANKDKIAASNKARYLSNKERHYRNTYRWREENPDKYRAIWVNRRARVAATGGKLSGDEIKKIIVRQKGKCAACGARSKLTMDHIMPLALGGSGDVSNFQGLCLSCNCQKNAKHPIDFNRSIGLLL